MLSIGHTLTLRPSNYQSPHTEHSNSPNGQTKHLQSSALHSKKPQLWTWKPKNPHPGRLCMHKMLHKPCLLLSSLMFHYSTMWDITGNYWPWERQSVFLKDVAHSIELSCHRLSSFQKNMNTEINMEMWLSIMVWVIRPDRLGVIFIKHMIYTWMKFPEQ